MVHTCFFTTENTESAEKRYLIIRRSIILWRQKVIHLQQRKAEK